MSNNETPNRSQPALSADEIAVVARLEANEAIAAARAELDQAIERQRSIELELKAVLLKLKKAKFEHQTARENLRKAQANAAPKPQTLQEAMKAAHARYQVRQADPATIKANKNARHKRYLDKLRADPARLAEYRRARNEAQRRRRAENRRH